MAGAEAAEAAEAGMPATVAAAWGVRERSQRGPKPALSLGRIVDAGVRVADSEGLDAVSMGRVAASLDTAPMSLYRHVSSKEELVRLMVDAAWGDSPGPALSEEGWRAGLSRWAWGFRAALQRHPWAGRLPISGLPIMPREIAWFEDALACLAGTGLTEARKARPTSRPQWRRRDWASTSGWRRTRPYSAGSPTRAGSPRSPRSSRPGCSKPPTLRTTSSSSAWTASWTASGCS